MPHATFDNKTPVINNRKAFHDYHIDKTFEAGVVLTGTEVKSIREGKARITDAFGYVDDGEVWLKGMHISEYGKGTYNNHEPMRLRKLLLHREEIRKIAKALEAKGATLVPLKLYFKKGRAKIELGLAYGKKQYDKRATIADREQKRQLGRVIKAGIKGE
jgi:SsrA-binding protein